MHHHRETQSLRMHRRIASMIECNPDAVIGKALRNLHAWMASQDEPAFQEWLDMLVRTPPHDIAAFIVPTASAPQECDKALRSRVS